MATHIREMTIDDYDAVHAFWSALDGIGLGQSDSRESIKRYLARNPGSSFIAFDDDQIIGAVLSGDDGRRGFIHHLGVAKSYQKKGIGRMLVDKCLKPLDNKGIKKFHIIVLKSNQDALKFWEKIGWTERDHLTIMTKSNE